MKKSIFFAVFMTVTFISLAYGQATDFTYQGQLQNTANPANGVFDFEFALFDTALGGAPIGSTNTRSGVSVTNGIFSVNLDFGSSFPGGTRFLEIRVRQSGGGSFTTLSPRQPISSAPYSIKSLTADSAQSANMATTAVNATNAVNATTANSATNFTGPLGGDVIGTQAATTVGRLQGRNVASAQPNNGQVLKYNSTTTQWEPANDETASGGSGGTITGVTAGTGLTGGGTTGTVTVAIANGGVGTPQIADNSVTDAKITGVSGAKVAGAVTNSLQLGGVAANQFVQTGDPRLSDARPPTPGSPNYIQNSAAAQASSNFNVSGVGKAATFDAVTQYNLGGSRILGAFGFQNTVVGLETGGANMIGLDNTLVGFRAGNSITDGSANIFVGGEAGRLTTTGVQNVFVGDSSGENNVSGSQNSFFGDAAGFNTVGNSGNSFFGRRSGFNNTGAGNSFFGQSSGDTNTTGSNNSALGNGADLSAGNLNFTTVIGAGATGNASDSVFLGRAADTVRVPGNLVVTGGIVGNINGSSITNLNASNITTGTLNNARLGIVPIANGGTGSATQNFVDLTTPQSITGNKTFSGTLTGNVVNSATVYSIAGSQILSNGGSNNLFVGVGAGQANTTGNANAFFGRNAGNSNTSGLSNSFFGSFAGSSNTTGDENAFFGRGAGSVNTSGSQNAFFGKSAGGANANGTDNSFFGHESGFSSTSSSQNSFFGQSSGRSTTFGSYNSFFGALSGQSNVTGSANAFFGLLAGDKSTGDNNAFFGVQAGERNVAGDHNTAIGATANVGSAALSYATAIGSDSVASLSNSIYLGRPTGADTVRVPGKTNLGDLLIVDGGTDVEPASGGYIIVGASGSLNVAIDSNEIMARSAGSTATLALNADGGNVHLIQSGTGSVGIGTTTPDQKLSVNGNASKTGGTSWAVFSDERLKNIKGRFSVGLDAIRQLEPIRFEYRPDNPLGLASTGEQIGFSAQEVKKIIPEAVTTSRDGYLQLNVDPILWAMVNGIKEQDITITSQQAKITELTSRLDVQDSQIKEQARAIAEMKALLCVLKPESPICKIP
ncbi:MAG: tail fiber domain-containing protein [Pyrinomonadaceae bacterium]